MSGYIGTQPVPQATQTRDSFTCTAGQTSFATSGYTPSFLDVYLNGVKLTATDYTASNGSDVVLASGAAAGDVLEVVAFTAFEATNVTGATDFTVTGSFTSQGIDDNATSTAMTLDTSGRVMIGTTTEGQNQADNLTVADAGNMGMTLRSTDSGETSIFFSDGTSGAAEYAGWLGYVHSVDRMTFGTSGTERMRIDSTGAVTMPSQPAFLARPASNQSNLPLNATTTIAFGTEIFDQNADFNNSTNKFTAPVTGKYLLTTGLYSRSLDHDTSYYQLELATSNRVYYDIISMSGFDADVSYYEFKICVLADMDAGDTAFVRMGIPNNGAAQVQIDTVSNFSGHLVA